MTTKRATILILGTAGTLLLGLGATATRAGVDNRARVGTPTESVPVHYVDADGNGICDNAAQRAALANGQGGGNGPGDGTGNQGDGPKDGSGNGAQDGSKNGGGTGSADCDGTGPKGNRGQGGAGRKGRRGGRR